MDRLTKPGFNYTADFVASHLQSWPIAQALERLQAYEDSGLSPETVGAFAALLQSVKESERIELKNEADVRLKGKDVLAETKRLGWWGSGRFDHA